VIPLSWDALLPPSNRQLTRIGRWVAVASPDRPEAELDSRAGQLPTGVLKGLIPFNGRNCCHTSGIVVRVVGVRDQEERESLTVGSFEVLYAEMRRPLAALAYAVSGSWSAADDLAQEALEVAFKDWERIRSLDNPEAWVKRILLNRSVSGRRRRAAERRARARMNGGSDVEAFSDLTGDFERI